MTSQNSVEIKIRPPQEVMRLNRLGAAFPTRLSFMRRLIRHMKREKWKIERKKFNLDKYGYGSALYVVKTPERSYSLICFSHFIKPESRTDRVIAKEWDATFALFDGVPEKNDIKRLSENVPKQESGRYQNTELVISRANKSVRLFDNVIDMLSKGIQPDPDMINSVGYLMRTTAVYANGKFGLCDRFKYADRLELSQPFQVEMLSVYLIRLFTFDLVDHIVFSGNNKKSVKLDRSLKRHLGIGNATGLGMAPFLISHPILIHNWFHAREVSLYKIRSIENVSNIHLGVFKKVLNKASQHVREWSVDDKKQSYLISQLLKDLNILSDWVKDKDFLKDKYAWNTLYLKTKKNLSIECQELLVSLLLEPYPEMIDNISESLEVKTQEFFDPNMKISTLKNIIDNNYKWALDINFDDPKENYHFWYYSKEKLEPRRGVRGTELDFNKEMQIAIARDVKVLRKKLIDVDEDEILASFTMKFNDLRHIVSRIQIGAKYNYSEIQDNIISISCRPVNILRGKLAYFGASKFDPKSDLWTRITMYQGAPLDDELSRSDADDWYFPIKPVNNQCKSH
ncbi:hypothetical protein OAK17_06040 [Alphaproteobacteria bacterium]|nr:hypothetical protein [Alphaproteobacteria bacterium]